MSYKPGECGNPNGRPKVTLGDLPEGWVEKTLGLYAEGAADIEIRAQVFGGMAHETWTRLLEEEPLFFETVSAGRALSEAWWTRKGRSALDKQFFQNGVYALHMKNRFGWADKSDNSVKLSTPSGPLETRHSGSVTVTADLQNKSLDELTKMFTEKLKG